MTQPMPTLKPGAREKLDRLLQETVSGRKFPAIFHGATNAKETIYYNQAGDVILGDQSSGQVDENTVTEIFSQTKLVTCVAALQLVDRGLVSLDSVDDVERYLPEIGKCLLLTGYDDDDKPILSQPKNKITLRMLMSHTSGFVYTVRPGPLSKWVAQNPKEYIFDPKATVHTICNPLTFEPGTSFAYGTSIDWVGILVERVSGLSLEDYFQRSIFLPLGLKSFTFFPTDEVKSRKVWMCTRDPEGKVVLTKDGFGMGRPTEVAQVSTELLLGGAGLYGTQKEYLAFLRAILQSDPNSPHHSESSLISPESYAELFKPSVAIGEGYDGVEKVTQMVAPAGYIVPPPTPQNVNYSVGGLLLTLEDQVGRRKAGSACWSGAAKTEFWIDPKSGIAGICGTQLLGPPGAHPWYAALMEYEKELYAGIA